MTQATQPQPVVSPEANPEQRGFLRRGFDAVGSTPFALGARVGAHNTVDRIDVVPAPSRETVAKVAMAGATAVLAAGVTASEVSASDVFKSNSSPAAPVFDPDTERRAQDQCMARAIQRPAQVQLLYRPNRSKSKIVVQEAFTTYGDGKPCIPSIGQLTYTGYVRGYNDDRPKKKFPLTKRFKLTESRKNMGPYLFLGIQGFKNRKKQADNYELVFKEVYKGRNGARAERVDLMSHKPTGWKNKKVRATKRQ